MTSSQHKDITQLTHVAGMNSKPRLILKMRIVVARGLLVLLFGLGFFLSMIPFMPHIVFRLPLSFAASAGSE
jgi:hypothetical protein